MAEALAVSDVSCRAFSYFQTAERLGVCDLNSLLEGYPHSRAYLEDPQHRVPWDDWAELCDRFAGVVHSDQALRDSGVYVQSDGFGGFLHRALGAVTDVRRLYEVTVGWVGPTLYRSIDFALQADGDGALTLSAALKPGYRGCRAWFLMAEGALTKLPHFVGRPDAIVRAEALTERGATWRVLPPPSAGLGTFFKRLGGALKAPDAIFNELFAQQVQLNAAFEQMRRSASAFQNVLEALPFLVAVHAEGRITWANSAFTRFFGRGVVGASLPALFPEGERAALRQLGGGGAARLFVEKEGARVWRW